MTTFQSPAAFQKHATRHDIPIDHDNSDNVHRQNGESILRELIAEPGYYERDDALAGYVDSPRRIDGGKRVYRSVRSQNPRHCYNSTSFKYFDVALPRVTLIDGPYEADNDNNPQQNNPQQNNPQQNGAPQEARSAAA